MENKIVTAIFKDSTHTKVSDVWQYDYGQILRIQGLDLPTAVEVDFAVAGASESIARIGTTKDGVTDVVIPDSLIETGKNLVAYIYLRDSASGNTEYQIDMLATKRAKPEAYDRPEDKELFGQAIEAVNTAADRAEKAGKTAQEAATKTGQDAEQTAQDRVEVAKMVETVTDISEQVKKVEDLSNKAQAVENAGTAEVQEITQAGAAQKTAVEGAGTQAVESVENAQQAATEAVESAKTTAVQAVQAEGTTQTGNVTTEGTKQVKAVQDKGNEVLQSIPEDFQMQMESKLDKQQGVENKGKALVIGEDGNVAPGEVQSGGRDGIAIINTMSGESPLAIPDSAERVNKRLELVGKTEQNQDPPPSPEYPQEIKNSGKWNEETQKYGVDVKVTGKNLFDMNKFIAACNFTKNEDGTFVIDKRVERYDCFFPANTILSIEVLKVEDSSGAAVLELFYEDGKSMYIGFSQVGVKTFLIQKDVVYIKVLAYRKHEYKYIQLEKGNIATPYEPYKEQTLTLTSDRPITKWDRLVEQGGQIGWLYQSKIVSLTGGEEWETSLNAFYTTTYNFIKNYEAKCSHYVLAGITNQEKNNIFSIGEGVYTNSLWIRDTSFSAVQDFKAHLSDLNEKGDPIMVVSPAAQTEFIPLPQSEQNAIRALKTYYPTTVITADGGELDPDIKVTYTADTKNYIDNKVSAKVASIIRQYRLNTANLLSLMPMETQAAMIENDTNNILENAEEMKHE